MTFDSELFKRQLNTPVDNSQIEAMHKIWRETSRQVALKHRLSLEILRLFDEGYTVEEASGLAKQKFKD